MKGEGHNSCVQLLSKNAQMEICPTLDWKHPVHPSLQETCAWFANEKAGLRWYLVRNLALAIAERRLTQS